MTICMSLAQISELFPHVERQLGCESTASVVLKSACAVQTDFVQMRMQDVGHLSSRLQADTLVLNPPFGTRKKGADIEFLQTAIQVAPARQLQVLPPAVMLVPCIG